MEELEPAGFEIESLELNRVFEIVDAEHKELDELTKKIWTFCSDHGGDQVQILCHALAALKRSTAHALPQDPKARPASHSPSSEFAAARTPVQKPYPTLQQPDLNSQVKFSNTSVEPTPKALEQHNPFSQSESSKDTKEVFERSSYKKLIVDTSNLPKQATEQSPTQRKSTVTVSLSTQSTGDTIHQPRTYSSSGERFKVTKVPGKARVSYPRKSRGGKKMRKTKITGVEEMAEDAREEETEKKTEEEVEKKTEEEVEKKAEEEIEKKAEEEAEKKRAELNKVFEKVDPQEFFKKMFARG